MPLLQIESRRHSAGDSIPVGADFRTPLASLWDDCRDVGLLELRAEPAVTERVTESTSVRARPLLCSRRRPRRSLEALDQPAAAEATG